jgi:hypothetical protein
MFLSEYKAQYLMNAALATMSQLMLGWNIGLSIPLRLDVIMRITIMPCRVRVVLLQPQSYIRSLKFPEFDTAHFSEQNVADCW